ncbi:MAG: HAMP domain-containing histidine kinase [Spirochaetales bacterium]|jgi:signal transduction histidine kinase|nr:HAMP domain-containing histidine kinase [Spirochaetales bacterium]
MFLKSLNIRIAALFSGIFIIASAVLFAVFYLFQYNALVQEDRSNLEARTLEFWALYQTGGAVAVQRALTIESFLTDYDPFLLRIASSSNATIALYYPSNWDRYGIANLSEIDPRSVDGRIRIFSSTGSSFLDITTVVLPDSNLLQVGMSSVKRQTLLRRFRAIYIIVLLPIITLSFAGGIVFSTRAFRPINRLIGLTRSIIETGRMNERLRQSGKGDELDELTALFNKMLSQIETLLSGMRTSLDNVAHDLRTPMTRLRQRIETAIETAESSHAKADPAGLKSDSLGDSLGDSLNESLNGALEESDRMQSMLKTLMDISEAENGVMRLNLVPVNLSEMATDIAEFYGYLADEKNLTITCDAAEPVMVTLDVDRIRQVLTNLLDNAVKYTPGGGSISVSTINEGSIAVLVVSDTGVGISDDDAPHIWDRLYRGDRSRTAPGLGLGLGLVKAIVEAHRGSVDVESRAGSGSVFRVRLPAGNITKM